jgi:major membrane immunogen (membrane-anchored lipoprotein)
MIALLGASALTLAALQASIAAPTTSFRGCLHDAAAKATSEKVSADTIEAYLRNACTVQMGALKQALVDFRLKNGMSKKQAASDAEMTIDDYVSTPADNYKFMAQQNAPKSAAPAATVTPAPIPASQPTNPQPHN